MSGTTQPPDPEKCSWPLSLRNIAHALADHLQNNRQTFTSLDFKVALRGKVGAGISITQTEVSKFLRERHSLLFYNDRYDAIPTTTNGVSYLTYRPKPQRAKQTSPAPVDLPPVQLDPPKVKMIIRHGEYYAETDLSTGGTLVIKNGSQPAPLPEPPAVQPASKEEKSEMGFGSALAAAGILALAGAAIKHATAPQVQSKVQPQVAQQTAPKGVV